MKKPRFFSTSEAEKLTGYGKAALCQYANEPENGVPFMTTKKRKTYIWFKYDIKIFCARHPEKWSALRKYKPCAAFEKNPKRKMPKLFSTDDVAAMENRPINTVCSFAKKNGVPFLKNKTARTYVWFERDVRKFRNAKIREWPAARRKSVPALTQLPVPPAEATGLSGRLPEQPQSGN